MNDARLSDFYRGWLIEITSIELGFQIVCYSPCREKIKDTTTYSSEIEALQVARHTINWYAACQAISIFLRGSFEADCLCFEEWRSLHQSLRMPIKAQ
ncbi:MAG: hypothetical protein HY785_13415 [Oscillatoriophycideae cyanobacterium NC_groundwater_1537_Pr4_S-0.65um_50_18]|nr:hypothetical protein [Oscillatoriophycideae cyanobacterium NC_groundwater_1537_Pr4_S-0.65um_50_18]